MQKVEFGSSYVPQWNFGPVFKKSCKMGYVLALPEAMYGMLFIKMFESSWYKLLENTRKNWNNQKKYTCYNLGQKFPKTDTVAS